MGEQHRALDVFDPGQQIARGPEVVVIAGGAVLSLATGKDAMLPDSVAVAPGVVSGVTGGDEVVEDVHVFAQVAARRAHQTVGAVVVVVGRVCGDGNHHRQTFDAAGGGGKRQGAFIGAA